MSNDLKYALSLPLEPAVEENIQKLVAYADENLDFYIKRWQARAVKKKRIITTAIWVCRSSRSSTACLTAPSLASRNGTGKKSSSQFRPINLTNFSRRKATT